MTPRTRRLAARTGSLRTPGALALVAASLLAFSAGSPTRAQDSGANAPPRTLLAAPPGTAATLAIVEVLPASDTVANGAFIEVHNFGSERVNMRDLPLVVGTHVGRIRPLGRSGSTVIEPDGFAVVLQAPYRDGHPIPDGVPRLTTTGDILRYLVPGSPVLLYDSTGGDVVSSCRLLPDLPEGQSLERNGVHARDGASAWRPKPDAPSPGVRNRWFDIYFTSPGSSDTDLEAALIAFIESATERVELSLYRLGRPSIVDALIRTRQRLGADSVRIVTEAESLEVRSLAPFYEEVRAAGIPVVPDNASGGGSGYCHHKFFVVDRARVWTGSLNITNDGFDTNNNDAIVIYDPGVAEAFAGEFREMFEQRRFGSRKLDDTEHEFVVSGDRVGVYFAPSDDPKSRILEVLRGARESITILSNNFTDADIAQAILDRQRAGVRVRGLWDRTAAPREADQYRVFHASGTDVRIAPNRAGLFHFKCILVDAETPNAVTLTGSYNWSASADRYNDENMLVLRSRDITDRYLAEFERTWTITEESGGAGGAGAAGTAPPEPPRTPRRTRGARER